MRSLGKDLLGAALVAKRFSQRRCGHKKNPVDASSCILAMIGKKLLNCGFVHCAIVHLQKPNIGKVRMCIGAGVAGCALPCR